MKNSIALFLILLLNQSIDALAQKGPVHDLESLHGAIQNAKPGDEIIMANGTWEDVEIKFIGHGTKENPITLRAEEEGKVMIEGKSDLKLGGEYLVVSGLHFNNGFSPSRSVVEFRINKDTIANHCIITNCVIVDFNKKNRFDQDTWVDFWGRHNQLDHCYIAGKFNKGPTIVVNLKGNEHIKNYHQIVNNHFGPRPRKGGPSAETMRMGSSFTSMAPSHVLVANNFFERCNGEVEIISSKSNFNEFRNNIFYECEGSLVTRHGNYCIIDGNIFIGNQKPFMGGIRVINTGHWVTNNYFYGVIGEEFRSPLAIMNGIPKSPLNRYNQVTDVVVAYNSWIDCTSPLQFSVGANMSQKDVLPLQEIRSARPIRTLLANNLIYNHKADIKPIVSYDKVDGVAFKSNLIDNQEGEFTAFSGLSAEKLSMLKINDWLYIPSEDQTEVTSEVFQGFGFGDIETDVFGASRKEQNSIGAISAPLENYKIDRKKYGTSWFSAEKPSSKPNLISVSSKKGDLAGKIASAKTGDILELTGKNYKVDQALMIDKKITIKAKSGNKVNIQFTNDDEATAFRLLPGGYLILEKISIVGPGSMTAFAPLKSGNFCAYNLQVKDADISGFNYIMQAFRGSFADTISFENVKFEECVNGIELAAETDDRGDYNAEYLNISNCQFENIEHNVINFYRGGYDESTIGGILNLSNSTLLNCGSETENDILVKTRGIINVDLSGNNFKDNKSKYVAILWGEKNNRHSDNEIINSGEIVVQQSLKLKQIY